MNGRAEAVFAWASLDEVLAEPNVRDLIVSQFEELSPLAGIAKLDPDIEHMRALEKAGMYRVWTARCDGLLVGFIRFLITPHPDYRTTLFAFEQGHYLDVLNRDTWLALRFWRAAESALRELGVKIVMSHDNHRRPLGPMFRRLRFRVQGTVYLKAL